MSFSPGDIAQRFRDRISSRLKDNRIIRFDRNKRSELNQWDKSGEKAEKSRFQPLRMGGVKVPRPQNHASGEEPAKPNAEIETKTDTDPKPQFSKAQERLKTAAHKKAGMDSEAQARAQQDRAAYVAANRKRFGSIIKTSGSGSSTMTGPEKSEKDRTDSISKNKKRFSSLLGT